MKTSAAWIGLGCSVVGWLASTSLSGCSDTSAGGGTGGTSSSGGAARGGAQSSGGASSGGSLSFGGASSGGAATGGAPSGGGAVGGTLNAASGGASAGGSASGGQASSICPAASSLTGSPIPSNATSTRVAGAPPTDAFNMNNFTNVEGPVWIGDALYFSEMKNSDVPPSRIFKVTANDAVSVFIQDSGSNGLAVDANGNLVAASHGVGGLVSFDSSTKAPTTLVSMYGSKRFNSPNDLTFRSDGTLYFTDPAFQNNGRPQGSTLVYRVLPRGDMAYPITDYINNPNGITLSLDEKLLFVSGASGVKWYGIDGDSVAFSGKPFGSALGQNGDGMVIDCAGNLYVTQANSTDIIVVDPNGVPVANSPIKISGPSAVTNVAFGGADRKTLYVTGQGSSGGQGLFKVTLNFPGMPY